MNEKTILVTGISGFIGKQCAIELLNHGYRVRGTLRSLGKSDDVRSTLARHCDTAKLEFVQTELQSEGNWSDAMQGVHGVLHVASPVSASEPKDPDELIRPAVDGTLRVLKHAQSAGVQRFVHTSSVAAIMSGHGADRVTPFTEEDWTQLEGPDVSSYAKSKTLSEQAARSHLKSNPGGMHYASINPGIVLGPVLDADLSPSASLILSFMRGKYPGCPKLAFPFVDVRDVAKMHRLAMETDLPSGGRYVASSEHAWLLDMVRPIKAGMGSHARKVPTLMLPNFVVRLIGIFDPAVKNTLAHLGVFQPIDNRRTRSELGIDFIPLADSALATARDLVDLKMV
jgi:dihydroflavonol-4-reductase